VLLRQVLLGASRNERLRAVVENAPVSRSVVARYVAGNRTEDAVRAARKLVDEGLMVTIDYLGEYTTDQAQAEQKAQAYLSLLAALAAAGLTSKAEVSVKLSAIGQALPTDGEKIALDHARAIAAAARAAGTTMTLDMEDHTTTESTLRILRELRQEFPETGAVLQAMLRRTEADCRELAYEGSRVRLCKGAYDEPASVAHTDVKDIDHSYVRCLRILMSSPGYPMVATHDPRLIAIAGALATRFGRDKGSYEFQMLHGVRPQEQRRLARTGEKVRVYLPYGEEWYGYLVRRLAERPANMSLFLRSLVSTS
jgi:proline dehydrogenase